MVVEYVLKNVILLLRDLTHEITNCVIIKIVADLYAETCQLILLKLFDTAQVDAPQLMKTEKFES